MCGMGLVERIKEAMIACQTDEVLRLVKEALGQGVEASVVVKEGLTAGIRVLGDRFERGEAFRLWPPRL